IVPGDGGVYYDVKFEGLVLRLALQEVIEGLVVETTSFGAFVSLGPIDAMLHVSQISDEYINFDEKNARLICQDSKRFIGVGDTVRVRVVTLSLNEREPRDSKIGLTMRQAGLVPRSGSKRRSKRRKRERLPVQREPRRRNLRRQRARGKTVPPMNKKKQGKVCRDCHRVVDGENCVICGTTNLSDDWSGYLVIIDPENSDVAKRMNIKLPGRYALKVR